MKHTDLKRAVKNTASVLAALLLMGMLTGCFGPMGPKPNKPNEPVQPQKVIITVKGDEGVIVKEPKTIEVAEGKKWSEVKNNVNVSYKDGYKAKGFKMDSESGLDLYDGYIFYQNKTVFAISKKIPRPNDPAIFKTDGNGTITGYTCDKEDLPKSLVIPAKIGNEVITGIGEKSFEYCGLTNLDLSACTALTKIDYNAFSGCKYLTELKLPKSLTEIAYGAFKDCPIETLYIGCDIKGTIIPHLTQEASIKEHLKNLILEEGVTIINFYDETTGYYPKTYYAFKDCSNLTGTIVFPASLKTIEESAFEGCTKLQGADFSACTNFTEIGESTFKGCTGLTEVKLPASLTTIGGGAFKDCPIETLHIGCDIKGSIIDNLTHEASVVEHLKNIKLGEGVRTINESAFKGCTGLTSIDLSGCTSLIEIGIDAFKDCKGLTELKLPASLTYIGGFSGCTGLTNIDLSVCTSLIEIGREAFSYCSNLAGTIVFPASLKTIKSCREGSYPYYDYVGAFEGCTKLQGADFSACTNFTHIENSTFSGCTDLTEVKLPESLNEIGEHAFYGCAGLTEVKLPASINKIDAYAFYGCAGLTSAVFADKNGWAVYNDWEYKNKAADIQQSKLADASKAAKYLREETDKGGYCNKFWKKN